MSTTALERLRQSLEEAREYSLAQIARIEAEIAETKNNRFFTEEQSAFLVEHGFQKGLDEHVITQEQCDAFAAKYCSS